MTATLYFSTPDLPYYSKSHKTCDFFTLPQTPGGRLRAPSNSGDTDEWEAAAGAKMAGRFFPYAWNGLTVWAWFNGPWPWPRPGAVRIASCT